MWLRLVVGTASLAILPLFASAQGVPGLDFQVNTYTMGGSTYTTPSVAGDGSGGFFVVWNSEGQDGSGGGIFGRRYDGSGASGPEFRVNTFTSGNQFWPRVAGDGTGRFVVVWASYGQDGSGAGVFGQRYDASGSASGSEFQINQYTTGSQSIPAVAMAPDGSFMVVWESFGQDGEGDGVFAREYDAVGTAGSEFGVNTYTTGSQAAPVVALNASGTALVVWDSNHEGASTDVFARRLVPGIRTPREFRVNTYTTAAQGEAAVAAEAAGGFVVVWASFSDTDGSGSAVRGQRYSSSAVAVGGEFQANTYTTESQDRARVAAGAAGTFVVSWDSPDESGYGAFARGFDSTGTALSDEFRLNAYTTDDQGRAALASVDAENFVATWVSAGQDGFDEGVFGRRFHPDVIFRDGFENGSLAGWTTAAADAGDLSVTGAAGQKGTVFGLQGVVDDTAGLFVQDSSPNDESRYRARFYVDPNGFDPGETSGARRTRIFIVFAENPSRRLAAIVLRRVSGVYALMGRVRLDNGNQVDTGFFTITDASHWVELDWKRSSAAGANDGTFALSIDGVPRSTLTGLDTDAFAVDFVRLGALSVKPTSSGTLYWDEFESRRASAIGP